MSEFFEVPEEDEADEAKSNEESESTFEADPATVAFLDQESAAFAEVADEFEAMYGFRHECHCDEDYAKGRVGEVTECYAGMIVEALATCAKLNHENGALKSMLETMMTMNNQLMDGLAGDDSDAPAVDVADVPVKVEELDA